MSYFERLKEGGNYLIQQLKQASPYQKRLDAISRILRILRPLRIPSSWQANNASSKSNSYFCKPLTVGLIALFSAAISSPAVEPEDILIHPVGPVTFYPRLALSGTFNDNIFYREFDKKTDYITRILPGLRARIGRSPYRNFTLTYDLTQSLYANNSQQDATDQVGSLISHLEGNRLSWDGNDRISYLTSILSSSSSSSGLDADLEGGQKENRFIISDNHRLSYDLREKLDLYGQFRHTAIEFESGARFNNRRTFRGTLGSQYDYSEKTGFLGEVYLGQDQSTPNANISPEQRADYLGAVLGATGEFTRRLSGSIRFGYEWRRFTNNQPDANGMVVSVALQHRLSARTFTELAYDRSNNLSTSSSGNYVSDRVTLTIRQIIGNSGKLSAFARGAFDHRAYSGPRLDTSTTAGGGLSYDFYMWLRGDLAYNFQMLDSNEARRFDYKVNRVTLSLSAGF